MILQPIFQNSFFIFFVKTKMKSFWFLFSNFRKKWKWKFNEFIFQFSKQNKMAILFLSSLFNSGKKNEIKNVVFLISHMCCYDEYFVTNTSLWRHNDVIRDEIRVIASHMRNQNNYIIFWFYSDLSFLRCEYIYCFRV